MSVLKQLQGTFQQPAEDIDQYIRVALAVPDLGLGPDGPINGRVIMDLWDQLPLSYCWAVPYGRSCLLAKNHKLSHLCRQTPIMMPFFCLHIKIEI